MKVNYEKILLFKIIIVSLCIISSATFVSTVQSISIDNIFRNVGEDNLNQNINDTIRKIHDNNDQIKKFKSILNQSNFPLVMYYANDTAFYQYHPETNSLQIIINEEIRDIINSCCSWTTIEDIIIIALNQNEYSPEWTQYYDSDMPCFNIDFNSSPINIPLNILCDFNETLLKTSLNFQDIEPLLLVQIKEEYIDEDLSEKDITSIKILTLLNNLYFTTFLEFIAYVIFFITTFHIITPLLMAELFYCCVVINTNTNPATNIAYFQYGHVLILEFIIFIVESVMIYWLCKTMDLRMTIPGAINLSLFANIYSYSAS